MAFGFGFNKQKVLSAAEKYVQQGKMQHAIAEYEKVLKADPKDLTVTNTVGDLYSRLGEVDRATECFKTVGDAYANQGFTVKAIAMYKKISKLKPSLESVLKLAELYTQQGLFNDARAQYLQVAEGFLKSGELENAVRIFQKILEMDPENTNMRIRLAEVYVRLGKKNDAWQIFSAAAETLRSKGSLAGAEEVLQRMLTLDPGNSYALLMRGRNLLEAGDADAAVEALQKVSDLDSNPEGLHDLLRAYLKTGRLSDAGTLAGKLLAVHNDLAAIASFADALMKASQYENALQVYDQHAERLLAEDSAKVLENLHTIIGHVRDNPASLEKLLDLFQKAGESTHVNEVLELLAHASVQSGDLPRARDLYRKLATAEPGNPLHMNSYQQVVSQLGGPSATKLISAEEAAVIVDELEATAPSIHQHYSDPVALAVRSALTDAELFISYNMPAKALGPLMAALPLAPQDLRLNQRLAALHTRASRFAEAGVCCRTLQNLYSDAGYPQEATSYGELADRYEDRSTPAAADSIVEDGASTALSAEGISEEASPAPWPAATTLPAEEPEFAVVSDAGDSSNQNQDETHASPVAESHPAESLPAEIDLSSEWDDSITIDAEMPAETAEIEITHAVGDHDVPVVEAEIVQGGPEVESTAEVAEEIRFYLEHGMPEQAASAFDKLQSLTSDAATMETIRAEIAAALQHTPATPEAPAVEAVVEPFAGEATVAHEAEALVEQPTLEAEVCVPENQAPPALIAEPVAEVPVVQKSDYHSSAPPSAPVLTEAPALAETQSEHKPGILQDFVSDLECSLGGGLVPQTLSQAAETQDEHASANQSKIRHEDKPELEPIGNSAPTSFGIPQNEVIGEFVADLEASLGDEFLKVAPAIEPEPAEPEATLDAPPVSQLEVPVAATPVPQAFVPAPVAGENAPLAASAAAASSGTPVISAHVQAATSHPPSPQISPVISSAMPSGAAKVSPFGEDAGVDLAEMFGELKQDLESGSGATDEDPETHYNLGIAFREMGLLDEAIGELQKTCQAVDRGHPFPQVMQTYTWLAQCFLDKGVPEAAIRWYQKALVSPGIDEETRTALYYELAAAYEAAGDKTAALKNFMEVYGRNIDYRDVAERIKPLKS